FPAVAPAADGTAAAPAVGRTRFGAARVLSIVAGGLVALLALAALVARAVAVVFDQTQRDAEGYLATSPRTYDSATYALVSDSFSMGTAADAADIADLLGTVRLHAV